MYHEQYRQGVKGAGHWWFIGKIGLIDALCSSVLPKNDTRAVLDIGCGRGDNLPVLMRYGQVTAMDIASEPLQRIPAEWNVKKICCDACALPFSDDTFNCVCSFDVFEHIADDTRAVAEVVRVLAPGGLLVVTVPAFPSLFGSHDRAIGHFRRYTKHSLRSLFTMMTELRIGFWNCALFPLAAAIRAARRQCPNRMENDRLPTSINALFTNLLRCENHLIRIGMTLPWGLTLYGIFRKAE